MTERRKRFGTIGLIGLTLLLCLGAFVLYRVPVVNERLAWRFENLRISLLRILRPPEQQVFVPQAADELPDPAVLILTPTWMPAGMTATPLGQDTTAPQASPTSEPVQASPTPLPVRVILEGVRHEYQKFNNCGPATLAMALSYWGWQGDQLTTRAALRPNHARVDDKNVNPWEMVAFSNQQPGLRALMGVGGELELLKGLVSAGFPVIIEIGIQPQPKDWMGHYLLISGYDDAKEQLITQDSLSGSNLPVNYAQLEDGWRGFNDAYVVVYPQVREGQIREILGEQFEQENQLVKATEKASLEIPQLEGRDQFFAWYNLGSSLTALGNYADAAKAYDRAFEIYATIPEQDRPWRMVWYQSGALEAYYHTARYQDVITLGNQTLDSAGGPVLEEVFYWLGRAREATGDLEKAIYDYGKAVEINPDSTPARQELERLGVSPP